VIAHYYFHSRRKEKRKRRGGGGGEGERILRNGKIEGKVGFF
jgi:hypothetical protein